MPTTERIKIVGVQFAVNPDHERGTEMTAEEQQHTIDFLTTCQSCCFQQKPVQRGVSGCMPMVQTPGKQADWKCRDGRRASSTSTMWNTKPR